MPPKINLKSNNSCQKDVNQCDVLPSALRDDDDGDDDNDDYDDDNDDNDVN